jgi:hypothetical protein
MSVVNWFNQPIVVPIDSPASDLMAAVRGNAVVLIQDASSKYYAYQPGHLRIKPWFVKLNRLRVGKVMDYFQPHFGTQAYVIQLGQEPPDDAFCLVERAEHGSPVRVGFRTSLPSAIDVSAVDLSEFKISGYKGPAAPANVPAPAGNTVSTVRYPVVQPSQVLIPGTEVDFTIDLPSTSPSGVLDPDILSISGLPADWHTATIMAEIASASIEFKTYAGPIVLKRDGTSIACVFRGKVNNSCMPGQSISVIVTFLHENRVCGYVRRTLTLGQALPDDDGAIIGIDFDAAPPVLTVSIFQIDPDRPGRLLWSVLVSPGLEIPGMPGKFKGEINLGGDPASFISELFASLSQLKPGQHMQAFYGFGEALWRKSPDFFKQSYWAIRKSLNEDFAIQFISDDANIPWEMMRPIAENDDLETELLVMTHPIARCVGDSQGSLRYRLPAGRIATIAPNYLKANDRLERAQVETKMLQDRYSAVSVNGIRNDVWGLFANGLDHDFVSIVHFAGHGDFPLDDPGQSLLKLQDGDLTAREVDTSEVKLGKRSGCLVFFNACKTGSTGGLLGGVGGWAEIILRRRFGGFIAPLWAVDDDDAAVVSASLFDDLLNRKVPVSQALLSMRKKFGKRSPTYLAYLFYGDVGAKIQ